jgi:hypothetical protein
VVTAPDKAVVVAGSIKKFFSIPSPVQTRLMAIEFCRKCLLYFLRMLAWLTRRVIAIVARGTSGLFYSAKTNRHSRWRLTGNSIAMYVHDREFSSEVCCHELGPFFVPLGPF